MAKNITLAVDEAVLEKVRRIAAERGTTVNALVREHLAQLADQNDRAKTARKRLVELARASTVEVGPVTWTRDDLHER
jgi:hypothetical protein